MEEDGFKINKAYADNYEVRKKKADKRWLEAQFGPIQSSGGEESSSSEDEDELGELVTPEVDSQIVKIIEQIKLKDPELYKTDRYYFTETEIKRTQSSLEKKPVFLKDYHRERILAGGEDQEDAPVIVTHAQEQEKIKDDFKSAVNADFDEGDEEDKEDFFKHREKGDDALAKEEEDYRQFLLDSMASVSEYSYVSRLTVVDGKNTRSEIKTSQWMKTKSFS
jgi:protein KRI1